MLAPALEGRDLIARAKTGTGKTLAFGIPILKRLSEDERSFQRLVIKIKAHSSPMVLFFLFFLFLDY